MHFIIDLFSCMEVHILYAFMEAYKEKKWLLSMLHQALKIVSNWLSSVKQDRNYYTSILKLAELKKAIKSI